MKLSRACGYAVRAAVALAVREPGDLEASHHLAALEDIPRWFLLQVLGWLAAAGVLDSSKGPNGGYRLARPASKITLLEIVEAVDGPIRGEVPHFRGKGTEAVDARLQEVCQRVADATRRILGKVRLADLASGKK